jgi:hypothetical protein
MPWFISFLLPDFTFPVRMSPVCWDQVKIFSFLERIEQRLVSDGPVLSWGVRNAFQMVVCLKAMVS